MTVDSTGKLSNVKFTTTSTLPLVQPLFEKVKDISSIFMDNSHKTIDGYLITKENLPHTIKLLTNYLKQN